MKNLTDNETDRRLPVRFCTVAPKNGAVKFFVINQLTFALMYFAISS